MIEWVNPSLLVPPLRRDLSLRALEAVHAQISDIDAAAIVTVDYDHVPVSVLPALAEQTNLLGDAGWDFAGYGPSPEAKKRTLLKKAVPLQSMRGTRYAVEQALIAMNASSRITEWWEQSPQGQPYTFKIDLLLGDANDNLPVLTKERTDTLIRAVKYWKNVRSAFTVRVGVQYTNTLRTTNAHQRLQVARFSCEAKAVQPNPFTNTLRVANVLGRGLQIMRLTMECTA